MKEQSETNSEWWRSAVIYQIYPRSFSDSNGDGVGDLPGITDRLEKLKQLGIDAIWLSPFYVSPQKDGGYDVADYKAVDPLFGTLQDFDQLIAKAHSLQLRVIIDLVPNHTSSEHQWFKKALAAEPDSKEREFYHFREGRGRDGELPPNNWQSMFGGSAWTRIKNSAGKPGQWYLHLFDASQPDLNWDNPEVRQEFEKILRFWLDRGVDGFRVDQPHAMVKAAGLPDHPYVDEAGAGFIEGREAPPMWFQDGVHEIFRSWRQILDSYPGQRAMCGEAYVLPLSLMALWVRPDEFHQTFNFRFLDAGWEKDNLQKAISESFEAFGSVGAPATWVLNNHDVMRSVSRFGGSYGRPTASDGVGPNDPQPDNELGLKKARAAALFMLALPGSSYLYQGEELGLPEHTTLPNKFRQDPTFFRTGGQRLGRDGCRVPLPWNGLSPALGFSESEKPWLPQPTSYQVLNRESQEQLEDSTLNLYKRAIAMRKEFDLGNGAFSWASIFESDSVLSFRNKNLVIAHNFSNEDLVIPKNYAVLLASEKTQVKKLGANQTVWLTPIG